MFESLHFGIKRSQCVLNGVKLTPRTLLFQMEYDKVGCCHQNYLLIYVDDLSHELTLCKSESYIDDQCMNHVMYADDVCLMAPRAIMVSHRGHNCISSALTILDSALTS